MKTKHLFILTAVLLVLSGTALFQRARESHAPAGEIRREMWKPMVPADLVSRIVFSKPKAQPVSLTRIENGWKIDSLSGVTGDKQKISQIIEQLNQLQAEWRAEGEDLYPRFGVGEDQAFRLQIFNASGGAMIDFYIGVQRAGRGVFIRLPGKPKIYFTAEDLPALFGLYADLEPAIPLPIFFADLRLVPETFEQIQRFEITEYKDGAKTTLAVLDRPSVEAGTPWKFVADLGTFSPGFEKIEFYLEKLTGAHAENIAPAQPGWKVDFEIMVRDERGKVLRLEFMKTGNDRWLAKRENEPQIFEVSGMVAGDLKMQDAEFVQDNPLQIELDESFSVEIHDPKRTEVFSSKSGWASAVAILDAASRLRFLRTESGITAADLKDFPPSHWLKIKRLNVDMAELNFYASDAGLQEIKMTIAGQNAVYVVTRAFFETLFIPENAPPAEEPTAPSVL